MIAILKWFFVTGALCGLCGMIWGIQMSASHDHMLSFAHGHLNLTGFVAMSIFGGYFALTPHAAQSRLALVHYGVTIATVALLTLGIVLEINDQGKSFAKIGSVLAVSSMALFSFMILRNGVGVEAAGRSGGPELTALPGD